MNIVEKIIDECESRNYCQPCPYYSHNTGSCIFYGKPKQWEKPTVNTALRLENDLTETPKRKRRGE